MARRELISGPNFSGRSAALMALLRDGSLAPESFYVGPYSEAALSGLTSTITDEIDIYRAKDRDGPDRLSAHARPAFAPLDFAALGRRRPPAFLPARDHARWGQLPLPPQLALE